MAEFLIVWVDEPAEKRVRKPMVPVAVLAAVLLLLSSCGATPTRNARPARKTVPGAPTDVVATSAAIARATNG